MLSDRACLLFPKLCRRIVRVPIQDVWDGGLTSRFLSYLFVFGLCAHLVRYVRKSPCVLFAGSSEVCKEDGQSGGGYGAHTDSRWNMWSH